MVPINAHSVTIAKNQPKLPWNPTLIHKLALKTSDVTACRESHAATEPAYQAHRLKYPLLYSLLGGGEGK